MASTAVYGMNPSKSLRKSEEKYFIAFVVDLFSLAIENFKVDIVRWYAKIIQLLLQRHPKNQTA